MKIKEFIVVEGKDDTAASKKLAELEKAGTLLLGF